MQISFGQGRVLLAGCMVLLAFGILARATDAKLSLYRDSSDFSRPFASGVKMTEFRMAKLVLSCPPEPVAIPLPEDIGERSTAVVESATPRVEFCSEPKNPRAPPLG